MESSGFATDSLVLDVNQAALAMVCHALPASVLICLHLGAGLLVATG